MHHVVGRDPVGGDHEDLAVEAVHLPDLPGGEQGKIGDGVHAADASNGSRRFERCPAGRLGGELRDPPARATNLEVGLAQVVAGRAQPR